MAKKYNCVLCNFHTNNLYNHNQHMNTKKHNNKTKTYTRTLNKNEKCKYCCISILKKNMKRHHVSCKKYSEYLIKQDKNKIIEQLRITINKQRCELINIKLDIKNKNKTIHNLVNKMNNMALRNKSSKKKRKRRQQIPSTVRNTIWEEHMGNKKNSKCYCCGIEPITKGNFECGHIVSNNNGGNIHLTNLRPICGLCNKSMGTQNMIEFMKQYGYKIK